MKVSLRSAIILAIGLFTCTLSHPLVVLGSQARSTTTIENSEDSPRINWKAQVGSGRYGTPIIADRFIYLAGETAVSALDVGTGQPVWEFDSARNSDFGNTSLTLVEDTLLFGFTERKGPILPLGERDPSGIVFAIDATTGEEKWHFSFSEEQITASVASNGIVYVGAGHEPDATSFSPNPDGYIYALELASGRLVWKLHIPNEDVLMAPAVHKNVLYVVAGDYYVTTYFHAIDLRTQQEIWRVQVPDRVYDTTTNFSPLVTEHLAYVPGLGSLYAIDIKTGKFTWEFSTVPDSASSVYQQSCCQDDSIATNPLQENWSAGIHASAVVTSVYIPQPQITTTPYLADGIVYIGVNLGIGQPSKFGSYKEVKFYVLGLDAETGQEKWRFETPNEVRGTAVIIEETLYIDTSCCGYFIQAIDMKTRQVKWKFNLENFSVTPIAHSNGVLYIADYDSNLYALQIAPVGMPRAGEPQQLWYITTMVMLLGFGLILIFVSRANPNAKRHL